jgi:translation initiation factor 1
VSNPFSKLAALKDALPPGEKVGEKAEESAAPLAVDRRFANKLVVAKSRKGRGGKTVTAIRGLVGTADQLEELARELKKALGVGASVEDGEVLVQGEQEKRVAAWLEAKGAKRVILGT